MDITEILIKIAGEMSATNTKVDQFTARQDVMNSKLFTRSDDHERRWAIYDAEKENAEKANDNADKKRSRYQDMFVGVFGLSIGGTIIHYVEKMFH